LLITHKLIEFEIFIIIQEMFCEIFFDLLNVFILLRYMRGEINI